MNLDEALLAFITESRDLLQRNFITSQGACFIYSQQIQKRHRFNC